VQYRFEEPVPCATDRSQATKRGQFQIVPSNRPRRQAVCEWHAHRDLLFRPIVFLIRRLVFINIHLRLIEHDHYDFAEVMEISSMTCLILPGRTLADLAPRAARQLVSSVKSVAKHRKMEPATRTTPSLTRCSTLAAREKNVAMRRGRGAFWGGPRLCSGSSLFPSGTACSHHSSRMRNHLTTGTQWSSISCAMRLRVACSLRAELPLGEAGYGGHRFSARCLASSILSGRVAHQQGLEMRAQGFHWESKSFPPAHL
jgi:hypothetical protein